MIKIPLCILILIGYIGDVFKSIQLKTYLCSYNMYALYKKNYYSNTTSKSEQGFLHLPIKMTLEDALENLIRINHD